MVKINNSPNSKILDIVSLNSFFFHAVQLEECHNMRTLVQINVFIITICVCVYMLYVIACI